MSAIFLFIPLGFCLAWIVKVLYSVWWKPKQLGEALRKQGINGYPYKFMVGNLRDSAIMNQKALSKPMNLSHDIAPRVLPFLVEAVEKYGSISFSWFGTVPQVVLMDSEMVREVLSNKFGHFQKPPPPALVKLLASGLATLEGEQWVVKRRLLNPAFHQEKLKGMLPSFSHSCNELVKRWKRSLGAHGSFELDAYEEFQNLTGDIISRTAFGSSFEEGRQIFLMQKELAQLVIHAFQTIYIPGQRFLPTKKNFRRQELHKKVVSLLNNIIEKREKDMKLGIAKNDDLLGIMLESNKGNHGHGREGMTREDVIEECKLFYFAGQETTAVLLTWTMVLLSINPIWQMRAREEILQVCGKETPTFESTSHLKTVTVILYEVLRLYPPADAVVRRTYKTMKLGSLVLPAGVRLLLPILQIHHDPKIWGDDANEFNPERFSSGIANASKNIPAFFPFGGGPRICIGQQFALLEAKMALAMILMNFSFKLSPAYTHAPHSVITLQPQYGAQIILQPA